MHQFSKKRSMSYPGQAKIAKPRPFTLEKPAVFSAGATVVQLGVVELEALQEAA